MTNFFSIMKIELKRLWTKPKYIVFSIFIGVLSLLSLIPKLTGALNSDIAAFLPGQASILAQILSPIVTVTVLFFTFGIISNDIKNHWFRTVLVRPVRREIFVSAKIVSTAISLLIVMLLTTAVPMLIFNLTAPEPLPFDLWNILGVFFLYFLHGILFILISTWLSCFLPGIFNILIFVVWMVSEQIISPIISLFLWDVRAALIFQDFYFPNGFADAAVNMMNSGEIATNELIWGFAALTLFSTLLFANINLIQIDKAADD